MSNSSNSSKGKVGNTKQPSPVRRWCLTLNNYSDEEHKELVDYFSSNSHFILGKEVGETGTPHLQGYMEFHDKKRFTAVQKICPKGHWEKAKWPRDKNYKYCAKDKDFIQNFYEKVIVEQPSAKFAEVIKLMNDYDFPKGDRKINVIVDRVGRSGKTEFTRWATQNFDRLIVTGGKAADMKNQVIEYLKKEYVTPKYIIVDVPRATLGYISWAGVEEVKNMLFYSGKYEGGMVVGNKPFFLMMMNEMPDLTELSKDRWNIIDFDN